MKRGGPAHPKTLSLAALLKVDRWGAVGILESLFHWSAVYAKRGDVGRHPNSAIAAGIGWTGDPDALMAALCESGWLDACCDAHRLRIHGWDEHADQSVRNSKEVVTSGFLPCYESGSSPDAIHMQSKPDRGPTGIGLRHRAKAKGKGDSSISKKPSSEFERLSAEPEIAAVAGLWVEHMGGKVTLGLLRAIRTLYAGAYDRQVAEQAINALVIARDSADRLPPRSTAVWCIENNPAPGYVLRPGVVEKLAAEYQRVSAKARAPTPITKPRALERDDAPMTQEQLMAIRERSTKREEIA